MNDGLGEKEHGEVIINHHQLRHIRQNAEFSDYERWQNAS